MTTFTDMTARIAAYRASVAPAPTLDTHYEDSTSTTDVWVTPTEDSQVESSLPDYM